MWCFFILHFGRLANGGGYCLPAPPGYATATYSEQRYLIVLWGCSLLFATKSFFLRFYKTRANTQRVLPEQTGLYRYDEWMVQDINDKSLNGS